MTPTITVDIGTTSVKLCVFDGDGALLVSRRVATPTVGDGIGEVYDVEALRDAVRGFVADLDPALRRSVQRIALAGVGESGGLVGSDLALRSPMILWHDQRGAALLRDITPPSGNASTPSPACPSTRTMRCPRWPGRWPTPTPPTPSGSTCRSSSPRR